MEPTIRIQSRLGKRKLRKRPDAEVEPDCDAVAKPRPMFPGTLARRLALAHYIDRLIDVGQLRNYAQAAAVLGITRARMSQLMDLVLLPPDVQEGVLLGVLRCCERDARARLGQHRESQGARRRSESSINRHRQSSMDIAPRMEEVGGTRRHDDAGIHQGDDPQARSPVPS